MALPPALKDKLRLPLIASPLFIISTPELVIAQCKAGIVGSFPALNARPADQLEVWLERITSELAEHDRQHPDQPAAPFAVNHIVHRSNARLEQDMEVCARFRVPIVISSLGARREINDAVHAWGGIVLHDVIDNRFAKKAIEKGADGLVAVAAGAGGHAGAQSPFALLQEIREWFDGPLALSGAISSGRAILTAQVMGADLAYMGSAFIATQEANAAQGHKQMILDSAASDVVYTNLITGVHGNYLKPSLANAGLDPDNLPQGDAAQMNWGAGSAKPKAWKDIWGCGQGIGVLGEIQPAGAFIEGLTQQYREACATTRQLVAAHA